MDHVSDNFGETPLLPLRNADELRAMFDESSEVGVRSFFMHILPEEGLGYGLVVPFLAYRLAALVSNNEDLNSLNSLWEGYIAATRR